MLPIIKKEDGLSLLERAKGIEVRYGRHTSEVEEDMIEMCLAYLDNDITLEQACAAVGCKKAYFPHILGRVFKYLYESKRLKIAK